MSVPTDKLPSVNRNERWPNTARMAVLRKGQLCDGRKTAFFLLHKYHLRDEKQNKALVVTYNTPPLPYN